MIIELLKHDYGTLWIKLLIIFGAWLCVLIAMIIDLYFGVKKSKQLGEHTSSEGFRRSVNKVVYYYAMMSFALLFDTLNPLPYYLPFPLSIVPIITILFAMVLIFTEAKSVREKAEDKLRRKTDQSMFEVVELIKNNKEILNNVAQYLQNEKNKQDEKTSDNPNTD